MHRIKRVRAACLSLALILSVPGPGSAQEPDGRPTASRKEAKVAALASAIEKLNGAGVAGCSDARYEVAEHDDGGFSCGLPNQPPSFRLKHRDLVASGFSSLTANGRKYAVYLPNYKPEYALDHLVELRRDSSYLAVIVERWRKDQALIEKDDVVSAIQRAQAAAARRQRASRASEHLERLKAALSGS